MTAYMLSGTARLKVVERIGEGKLLKTLPVDSGEVTPVEREYLSLNQDPPH